MLIHGRTHHLWNCELMQYGLLALHPLRSALALALGCIHRAKGGLVLQSVVGASTEALGTVARRPSGAVPSAIWALHALTLVAGSAGLAYMGQVKGTLLLCQELLVSGYEATGLKSVCARLANAMVAVLGPELTLGSAYYRWVLYALSVVSLTSTRSAYEHVCISID